MTTDAAALTTPQTTPPPLPKIQTRMSIASVTNVATKDPMRLLLYGVDGIGKSTLAASSESPIFIGLKDTLRVPRFPEPQSFGEVIEAVRELTRAEHSYQTVVLDWLGWLEPLIWTKVANDAHKASIEDIAYGSGYKVALDEWRLLLSALETLRSLRGMQVILIGHSHIKKFSNPQGEDFDRFEIKMHDKAAAMLREWCDAVLFATHEQYTYKANETDKTAKGTSTGARIMHTERSAAFDAKNRYSLPPVLPLDWPALRDAVEAGATAEPGVLRARIDTLLEQTSDEQLRQRVHTAVAAAVEDARKLARIKNHLTATLNIAQENKT